MSAFIALALLASAAHPLKPGEVVGFEKGGHLMLTRKNDQWQFEYAAVPKSSKLPDVPVQPDAMHFLMQQRDGQTFLIVTNGFKTGFRYKARIGTLDRQIPTSTCTIMPGLTGVEHWRQEIEVMILDDFQPSNEMVCTE